MSNMTNEVAIAIIKEMQTDNFNRDPEEIVEALDVAVEAINEIDHLIDRPCKACEYHRERGCTKWECVFTRGIRGGAI